MALQVPSEVYRHGRGISLCKNFLILAVVLALCSMGNSEIMEKTFIIILMKRWGRTSGGGCDILIL